MSKETVWFCIENRDGEFIKIASIGSNLGMSSYETNQQVNDALILRKSATITLSNLLEESIITEWFDIVPVRSLDKGHYKWELDKNGK